MKAIDITGSSPGGERTPISELVPLDTPLLIQVFPIYTCNFTCKYCIFSIPKYQREFISDISIMKLSLFKKCINDIEKFPHRIKVLRFVGMGEPLLHKQLPEMISYVTNLNVQTRPEKTEVLTNASLLTPNLSDQLINSGLSKLLISIQGTSAKKYKEISNIDINFETFINNITYFYNHRKNVKVHIKIADCALENEADKNKFFDLFGNICDTIGIEIIGPIHPGVQYNEELLKKTYNVNQYGEKLVNNVHVCSQPFFMMQINPDGKVVPCYAVPYTDILGDVNLESIVDIWNGTKYNKFRLKMLDGITNVNNTCANCIIFKHRTHKSDNLFSQIDRLKQIYKTL